MTSIEPVTAEHVAAFAALIDAAGDAPAKAENLSEPDPGSYLYLGAFVDQDLVAVLEAGTGRDFTHNGPPAADYPPPHAYLSLMYVLVDRSRQVKWPHLCH